ncbi:MAG TPA: TrkA family potassium uptake protein [Anaerolineae bacterium]|nr:TrkA family potassium uptake protein [Anaerolineae bacterium]
MFVIIVGGGKTGSSVAELLLKEKHRAIVVEHRPDIIERLKEELPRECVFAGDASLPSVLEEVGIAEANVVAAVTGEDEANLVVCTLARFEYNVPRIIARVNNPKNAWLFTQEMGVDVALNEADMMAHLVAEEMSLGDMMTLLKFRKGQYALVEEKVHPMALAIGKAIRDLMLPPRCVLAAIIRKGELIIPKGDITLQPADEIIALVHSSEATTLASLLGPVRPQ